MKRTPKEETKTRGKERSVQRRKRGVRKQRKGGKKRIGTLDSLLNPRIRYRGRAKTGMNVSFISFYEITPSFNPLELVSSRHRNGARNENTVFVNRDK